MALFAILMCVNFAACSSSDDDPTEEPEYGGVVFSDKKIAKVVSVTEPEGWKETRTFAYDDKGNTNTVSQLFKYIVTPSKKVSSSRKHIF